MRLSVVMVDSVQQASKPNITNEKAAFGWLFLCHGDNQNKQKPCIINKNSVEFSHGRKPNKKKRGEQNERGIKEGSN